MIIDVSGTILTPGNKGRDCLGNGLHGDVECCCDECDYMMCCFSGHDPRFCSTCDDRNCSHSAKCK